MIRKILGLAGQPVVDAGRQPKRRDPWFSDDERRRRVNEASPRSPRRWLSRRRGWLTAPQPQPDHTIGEQETPS